MEPLILCVFLVVRNLTVPCEDKAKGEKDEKDAGNIGSDMYLFYRLSFIHR